MPSWSHSKKEVRRALSDAATAAFLVKESDGHGHSWGYIQCQRADCLGRMSVWSTPKCPEDHARQIRRFMVRHRHAEDDEKQ